MSILIAQTNNNAEDWEADCLREWGRVLRGGHRHWCPEWDDLPIDDTLPEYQSCICYKTKL